MLFNSYTFVFAFLPVFLVGFWILTRWRHEYSLTLFLLTASGVFYAWWNWRYVFLLLGSILFNYTWSRLLVRRARESAAHPANTRLLLAVGVAANLGVLAAFKYANFLVDTVNAATGSSWQGVSLVLPLAISFFTFQQIAYLVDVYRGEIAPARLTHYALFVSFFPHLIAGPIVRGRELLPQLLTPHTLRFTTENLTTGLLIFAIGLFEKVMLADTFGPYADRVFTLTPPVSCLDAWGGALAFSLQVYFDFCGYTDMAIGIARMLNIQLPENFDSPFQADSIIDFWRRWHITLSRFLRDYLYIPLGGNRVPELRQHLNILVTMLLSGLWHGANWTFVVWGALHAVLLTINRLWRRFGVRLPPGVAWTITLLVVIASFVVFRAPSLAHAGTLLLNLVGVGTPEPTGALRAHQWTRLLLGLLLVLFAPNRRQLMAYEWRNDHGYAIAFACLMGLCIMRLGIPAPFVYFAF